MPEDHEDESATAGYVRVPEGVLCQHVADEMVLLHLESGVYYGLEPIGTRMLDLACELPQVEEVVSQLANEYDATIEVLERDLERLMDELESKGLIERSGVGSTEPDEDEER